jgi:hypothetical protein
VLLNMLEERFTGVWERAPCSLVAVSNVIAESAAFIFRVEVCSLLIRDSLSDVSRLFIVILEAVYRMSVGCLLSSERQFIGCQ